MADPTNTQPKKSSSLEEILYDFLPLLQHVHDSETLRRLRMRFPDIPAVEAEEYIKKNQGQHTESPESANEPNKTDKKKRTNEPSDQSWYGSDDKKLMVKEDGTEAAYVEEDRRYAHLSAWQKQLWEQQHPHATEEEKAAYFSTDIVDPQDPVDKLCPISRSRAQVDDGVYEIMGILAPETMKEYQTREQERVYASPEQDPAYRNALLIAKGKTREIYEKNKQKGTELNEDDLQKIFLSEQIRSLTVFAKNNTEKTKAYIKQGNKALMIAATLQREPGPQDIQALLVEKIKPIPRDTTLPKDTTGLHETTKQEADPEYKKAEKELQQEWGGKYKEVENEIKQEKQKELEQQYTAEKDAYNKRVQEGIEIGQLRDDDWVSKQVNKGMHYFEQGSHLQEGQLNPWDETIETEIDRRAKKRFTEKYNKTWSPAAMRSTPGSGGEKTLVPAQTSLTIDEIRERYEENKKNKAAQEPFPLPEDNEIITEEIEDPGTPDQEVLIPIASLEGDEPVDESAYKLPPRKPAPLTMPQESSEEPHEEKKRSSGRSNKNPIDTLRKISKMKPGGLGEVGGAGGTELAAAAPEAAAAAGGGGVIAVVVVIIIIILIVVLLVLFGGGSGAPLVPTSVSLTKTGPAEVTNGQQIDYTLRVSFPATTGRLVVIDKLPEDTEFVSASAPGTYDSNSKTVTWDIQGVDSGLIPAGGLTPFDVSGYLAPPYLLMPPTGASDITYTPEQIVDLKALGRLVEQYKDYLVSKVKNNDPRYVEPFVSVIWSGAIEGTYGNRYSWNCKDNKTIKINDGCSGGYASGSWQVSYGIQVSQAANHIVDDFNAVYGPGSADDPSKVHTIGQAIIDESSNTPTGRITNPATYPTESLASLVTKAGNGDNAAQQTIAIMLMDSKVGAVALSLEVGGDIARQDNWRATMEGWGQYYKNNMQKFSNRMQAIAQQYTGSSGSKTLTLSLRPLTADIYIINQAKAQAFAQASNITVTPTPPSTDEDLPPNDENCNGFYLQSINANPLRQNFGDPSCSLVKDNAIDKDKILQKLQELDPDNATVWFTQAIPCVGADFNPNYFYETSEGGEWGIFSMARNGKGGSQYNRGDVQWIKQMKNAIAFNRELEAAGKKWDYWPCVTP